MARIALLSACFVGSVADAVLKQQMEFNKLSDGLKINLEDDDPQNFGVGADGKVLCCSVTHQPLIVFTSLFYFMFFHRHAWVVDFRI